MPILMNVIQLFSTSVCLLATTCLGATGRLVQEDRASDNEIARMVTSMP